MMNEWRWGLGLLWSQVLCVVTVGVSLLVLLIEYYASFYCCGELQKPLFRGL